MYPCDKIWQLRTKLANPVVLHKPYEVAVIEFQYPYVWGNFITSDADVSVYDSTTKKKVSFSLTVGFYNSIPRIVK